MRRCPVPPALFVEDRFLLSSELNHYLCVVLRLKLGDSFVGFNGQGWERTYVLEDPDLVQDQQWVRALEPARQGRLGAPLTVCYGIPKGDKLDLVARQLTELGVGHLALWAASRSVALWKKDKIAHKRARLEKVIEEAARQCGRADVLMVSNPSSLVEMIEQHKETKHRLYFDPQSTSALSFLQIKNTENVALLIGPEGGITPDEIVQLEDAGWYGVALNCPVLRTETAAVVGAALVLEKMDWL